VSSYSTGNVHPKVQALCEDAAWKSHHELRHGGAAARVQLIKAHRRASTSCPDDKSFRFCISTRATNFRALVLSGSRKEPPFFGRTLRGAVREALQQLQKLFGCATARTLFR